MDSVSYTHLDVYKRQTLGIADENKIYKTNVPEGQECAEAAEDLVDKGCSIIFMDNDGQMTRRSMKF